MKVTSNINKYGLYTAQVELHVNVKNNSTEAIEIELEDTYKWICILKNIRGCVQSLHHMTDRSAFEYNIKMKQVEAIPLGIEEKGNDNQETKRENQVLCKIEGGGEDSIRIHYRVPGVLLSREAINSILALRLYINHEYTTVPFIQASVDSYFSSFVPGKINVNHKWVHENTEKSLLSAEVSISTSFHLNKYIYHNHIFRNGRITVRMCNHVSL